LKAGLYSGLTFEQYLSIDAVNKSSLADMALSPAHYYARHLAKDREPRKATRPMKLGTDIHCAILEPDRFGKEYVVIPKDAPQRPTKAMLEAKKPSEDSVARIIWWHEFDACSTGKTQINFDDHETCINMQKICKKHPAFKTLLAKGGQSEITMVWEDDETGLQCKARLDWLPLADYLLDLKSVESAHAEDFGKKAYDYEWHVQAAFYADGFRTLTDENRAFVFAAIEKVPPLEPAFFFATDDDLARGRRVYRPLLKQIAECKRKKKWPGYPTEIQPLIAPPWVKRQDEDAPLEEY
jgi:hypothetical protein